MTDSTKIAIRRPEGHDWIGVALLLFGAGVMAACVWLMTAGLVPLGVVLLVPVVPTWLIVASELRRELRP